MISCRICGASGSLLPSNLFSGSWRFDVCSNCDSFQLSRKPSDQELSDIYSDSYFPVSKYSNRFSEDLELKRRLNLLRKYSPEAKSVIDLGCGIGSFVLYIKDHYQVDGADAYPLAISRASFAVPGSTIFKQSLDSPITLNLEKYDICSLWDTLEHLWNPSYLFEQLRCRMLPGSILVLSTPAIDSIFAAFTRSSWPFFTPPEHQTFITLKGFKYLARNSGFTILSSRLLGKWTTVGFIFYKLSRKSPVLLKSFFLLLSKSFLSRIPFYVPTSDIRYLVLQKL
jgi:SAM-dependent methyltransferase